MIPKAAQLLGLAMRARKVITGEEQVLAAIRSGQAHLVLLAADASDNTAKKMRDKCSYYGVSCVTTGDRHELGRAIGKDGRVTVAVTDGKLAESIQRLLT
ncbi:MULTISPECIES: YlxQ family RNA-binding protein [Brevibacillus]|jgi:ribosomal protein L7Ae-like RNA K-turn-binding protein|uniref:Ribosomal protein L7Ae n=2 Tax=Brevibacillus TaxID=55080 RepID=A0A1I3NUX7_9BACL|nr:MULTISPECIES: YlxQ family RNA-binding protein [Brevibacillus]MDR7316000.1 ribosomal protein L7Ae-like RNA K-turn-binding protein [Brevibacillus nitrificans]MEC2128483.1 YlxQ family RNA-binding protein [Brevibacillus centrosporus]MED1794445.1 YlxQ family RNA-binding protein [Brevibacillus nitrificans]MED1949203.1 YlxQ family RNA-binding protein [Brevibacillus centrosporus]MED4909906.1 YlxQ family RNA-binding protein [Brevibacillus centrosporus]